MHSFSRSLRPPRGCPWVLKWKFVSAFFSNVHFFHFLSLFFYGSSNSFLIFGIKYQYFDKIPTEVPSRSMGDICKCQQSFWTLHNSFSNFTSRKNQSGCSGFTNSHDKSSKSFRIILSIFGSQSDFFQIQLAS